MTPENKDLIIPSYMPLKGYDSYSIKYKNYIIIVIIKCVVVN